MPELDYLIRWLQRLRALRTNRKYKHEQSPMDRAWQASSPRAQQKLRVIERLVEEMISGLPHDP